MEYNSGVIVLVISNHSLDNSLNCTPLSPITITNHYHRRRYRRCHHHHHPVQSVLNFNKKATENASNKLNCCVAVAYSSVYLVICLYHTNAPCRSVMISQAVFDSEQQSYRNNFGKLSLGPLIIKLVVYNNMNKSLNSESISVDIYLHFGE